MSRADRTLADDGRHVVVLNWRDPWHPEGGGSELYLHQVARRLAAGGPRVTVFTAAYERPLDEHGPAHPAPRRDVRDGVTYVRRGGHVTVYLWAALYLLTGRFGRVDRVLEVQNGMPFLARLFTRAPVVVLVHHVHREQWPVVGPLLARVGWFLESRVAVRVNRGSRYLAVSEVTRSELVGLGVRPRDVALAYNGMDAPDLDPVERSANPRMVVLSRLVPHKQIEHVIELMPRLLARHPDLTLQVLGSGWWHDNLVELRDRLGLTTSVVFHGHVTEEEKFAELARAWVHVLPSVKEGWGLSIVEAASVGTPSVAYRSAGGVQESILEGVTGHLAEDQAHAGELLADLLADADRREDLGEKARARAAQFSWDATTQRVADQLGLTAPR